MATKTYEHPLDIYVRTGSYMLGYGALFVLTLILFVVTACLGELTTARYILLTIAGAVSAAGVIAMGWYGDTVKTAWNDHQRAAAELAALDRKIREEESKAALYKAAVRDFSLYVNDGLLSKAGRICDKYYYEVLHPEILYSHGYPYPRNPNMERRYGKAGHTNYLKLAIDQLRYDCGLWAPPAWCVNFF